MLRDPGKVIADTALSGFKSIEPRHHTVRDIAAGTRHRMTVRFHEHMACGGAHDGEQLSRFVHSGGWYGGVSVDDSDRYRAVCGQTGLSCPFRREIPGEAADRLYGDVRAPFFRGDIRKPRLQCCQKF